MTADSATRLLVIRHGQTDWNAQARLQGHTDIPLNAEGRAQAQRLAAALDDEPLDAVYSSDLSRARDTALALAQATGAPLVLHTGLRERAFGQAEGVSFTALDTTWPDDVARWRRRDPGFAFAGGESLSDFYRRCVATAESLAAAHPGGAIALVAHGGVLDSLYRAATRLALDAPRTWVVANASINRLLYSDSGFALVGWNDDAHLQGPAA